MFNKGEHKESLLQAERPCPRDDRDCARRPGGREYYLASCACCATSGGVRPQGSTATGRPEYHHQRSRCDARRERSGTGVEIELTALPSGEVELSIEDSGTGILPDDMERIFDAFVTTKPNGMGMGLAICRSIIEAHGGTLSVSPACASRLGLSHRPAGEPDDARRDQHQHASGTHPVVFVVDDDESMRKALSNLIRSVDLQVEAFASAPEFLAVKLPDAPCCLILDIRLPGLSGLDFQAKLASCQD